MKRKEAIYRQMLEYRRSYEQEQRRASELEAQRRVLEASVHAVEVCWTQVSLLLGRKPRAYACAARRRGYEHGARRCIPGQARNDIRT